MKSNVIRKKFLNFFNEHGHSVKSSAPLLPSDPELLFNIAGMVPFKPYFLDQDSPPSSRITTSQKCLRTEDIEQVGKTARHLTFFEMLGNFSFGDYFKKEAIQLAWTFFIDHLEMNPDRFWITVFGGDEKQGLEPDHRSEEIWRSIDGVSENRILRLGKSENFWSMAETGPCGPCSEILYDQESKNADPDHVKKMILRGEDRILELWNLVFMEFKRETRHGSLDSLPQKNIDTGLGLERLAAVLQEGENNFDTDLFQPLMNEVENLTDNKNEQSERDKRIISDHIRACSFLISEGLLPGNEERGYVLRRLIRRAHLRGRNFGIREPFLPELVPTLVDIMGDHFEKIEESEEEIQKQLRIEEKQFEDIMDQGLSELENRINKLHDSKNSSMDGHDIFELYETHGLPVQITTDVLDEENIEYDEDKIADARKEHQQKSKQEQSQPDRNQFDFAGVPETKFTGYDELEREAEIVALYEGGNRKKVQSLTVEPGKTINVVFDRTPFYAEGGGQSGDCGWINDQIGIGYTDEYSGHYLHHLDLQPPYEGPKNLEVGQTVHLKVEERFRRDNMRHHTATHLLHHALRKELGDQVIQEGSFLNDEYLRFDFTYNESLDREMLDTIEEMINEWIYREIPVDTEVMDRDEAEDRGALAFFGEHYGQQVRVVMIEDHENDPNLDSKEFCGGTHLSNTKEVGVFTIVRETSVASGVRRIEAKAGQPAYEYLKDREEKLFTVANRLGIEQVKNIENRIDDLESTVSEYEDELERLRQKEGSKIAEELIESAPSVQGLNLIVETFEDYESDALKQIMDELRSRLSDGAILLINTNQERVQLLVGLSGSGKDQLDAGSISQKLGTIVSGGGGGRPDFAEAGGSDASAIPEAIEKFKSTIQEQNVTTSGG